MPIFKEAECMCMTRQAGRCSKDTKRKGALQPHDAWSLVDPDAVHDLKRHERTVIFQPHAEPC